jgi:hypothetical protein
MEPVQASLFVSLLWYGSSEFLIKPINYTFVQHQRDLLILLYNPYYFQQRQSGTRETPLGNDY